MRDLPKTLGGFFMLDHSRENAKNIIESSELKAQFKGIPNISINAMKDALFEALRPALDISSQEIILKSWSKFAEIQALADPEQTPPDMDVVKPLAKHRIESKHNPRLEILLDEKKIGELKLGVVFSAELEGFILKARAGQILEIRTGFLTAKGTLNLFTQELIEKASEPYALPGRITIDPPFEIPRLL